MGVGIMPVGIAPVRIGTCTPVGLPASVAYEQTHRFWRYSREKRPDILLPYLTLP